MSTKLEATLLVDARNTLGEGVLWDAAAQRVRWTDIVGKTLWELDPASGAVQVRSLPERVAHMAVTGQPGRLLLGLESGYAGLDLARNELTGIVEVESALAYTRLNDGRVDRAGNMVFGTIDEEQAKPRGGFYRLDTKGKVKRMDLPAPAIPNSICFSPDGKRMYFADSLTFKIMCGDYDAKTGKVSNTRVFVELPENGEPDGANVDAQGYLWNAQWGLGRVVRYTPDGAEDIVVNLPVKQPSCIAFGGAARDTLYITSARKGLSEAALADQATAGGLFSVKLEGIAGLPEVPWGGRW
ncbi:SMP-30/gluconolactonase/LRE family protein [Niveibacterium sp. SC-1]|uniref:SMP-30/gluconolactonase/LRE family protein n=1 Tax=Niveibacterium sp. SC-1 TaxID=3135646 RepID=UPI00311F066E